MTLSIVPADAGLLLVQAGCVAAPRAISPEWAARVKRLRGRGWALIPVASIVGVIFMIRYASGTANWLTYLALVAVPVLAFVALAWTAHGPGSGYLRPAIGAALTGGLFVLAWRDQYQLPGEAAATLLSGLSCVTLGVLLAAVTPPGWLKAGIVAMSAADVWLVTTSLLQTPNSELVYAAPGGGLPQLQSETFGVMNMGYGDFFVAGVLGGVLANAAAAAKEAGQAGARGLGNIQLRGAILTFVFAALFDLLFFVINDLPATVPVAATVIVLELYARVKRSRVRRPDLVVLRQQLE